MVANPREGVKTIGALIKRSIVKKFHNDPSSDDQSIYEDELPEPVSPCPNYQYENLPSATSIRLLWLQPGKGRDPIQCEVFVADLKTCRGQYEALSYVWGPDEGLLRIQIDNAGLEIQPNLYRALVDLRDEHEPRCLWIDAICINQSKTEIAERNAQVPLMCEIYRNAFRTICYLGQQKKETPKAYAMLRELAEEAKLHPPNNAETVPSFINHVPINPVQSSLREKYLADETILHVASCKWWFRAWTVQESLLSNNAVVVIGRESIDWKDLCSAVDHGFNIQIWSPVHFGFIKDDIIVPYLSLRALTNRQKRRHKEPRSPANELLHLLIHCRHRDSKDPKDKIYALLGLVRDVESQEVDGVHPPKLCIQPDYGLPVTEVYRQVSQELIEKLDNLDILGVTPKSTRAGLPSWVTDWSVTDHISPPLTKDAMDRDRPTHASKRTRGSFRFAKDGKTIILNGCELSAVQHLAEPLRYMEVKTSAINLEALKQQTAQQDFLDENLVKSMNQGENDEKSTGSTGEQLVAAVKKFYKNTEESSQAQWRVMKRIQQHFEGRLQGVADTFGTLFAWETFARAQKPASPGGKWPTVKQTDNPSDLYWQTLCTGTYQDGNVEKTKALFEDWSLRLQPVRSLFEDYPQAVQRMPMLVLLTYIKAHWTHYSPFWPYIACANGRRLGRAANGWLCLLPGDTEVGDRIILARGGRVPLVIRPLNHDDECFSFVGEAYIHGIMDGEAFVEEECKDIRIC